MTLADRRSFSEQLTLEMLKRIEAGTSPFQQEVRAGISPLPSNPISGTKYAGMNGLTLDFAGYEDPRWMTQKQAEKAGYVLEKGARAFPVFFFQPKRARSERSKPEQEGKEVAKTRRGGFMKCFHVFNACHVVGLPAPESPREEWNRLERPEAIVKGSGATVSHSHTVKCGRYLPGSDQIVMPDPGRFVSRSAYYATLLHELGHWTGHSSRMDRSFGVGKEEYAREELRAELASHFLCRELQIDYDPNQHAAYLERFVSLLREDSMELWRASNEAHRISSKLLELEHTREKDLKWPKSKKPRGRKPVEETELKSQILRDVIEADVRDLGGLISVAGRYGEASVEDGLVSLRQPGREGVLVLREDVFRPGFLSLNKPAKRRAAEARGLACKADEAMAVGR